MDDSDRRRYTPTLPVGTATVQLAMWDPQGTARSTADPAMIRRLVSAEMPVAASAVLRSLDESCPDPASGCRQVRLVAPPGLACPWDAPESEPRVETSAQVPAECTGPTATWSSAPHLVGDVTTLRQLGVPVTEAAQRALASGGVVSFAERFLAEGRITVETSPLEEDAAGDVRPTTLPGAYVDTPMPPATALFSPEAAERIGMDVQSDALFLRLDRPPTSQEEDAARAAVQNAGLDEYNFYVERGYVSEYGLGLLALVIGSAIVTLGATGVVTGLAQADSRPDYATLAAVGATPRMRRKLATCQAAVVAGLGTVLGMAAGFVPAIAFINADTQLNLILPWRNLLIVLVGLPLMAALLAGLMVRSRLPLERRLAA
jgi:putative ABC transport system permease protein